jgi:predicted  nucleic acid-binding Zn-ribbon protein
MATDLASSARPMRALTCARCGKVFERPVQRGRYPHGCSEACARVLRAQKQAAREERCSERQNQRRRQARARAREAREQAEEAARVEAFRQSVWTQPVEESFPGQEWLVWSGEEGVVNEPGSGSVEAPGSRVR